MVIKTKREGETSKTSEVSYVVVYIEDKEYRLFVSDGGLLVNKSSISESSSISVHHSFGHVIEISYN